MEMGISRPVATLVDTIQCSWLVFHVFNQSSSFHFITIQSVIILYTSRENIIVLQQQQFKTNKLPHKSNFSLFFVKLLFECGLLLNSR